MHLEVLDAQDLVGAGCVGRRAHGAAAPLSSDVIEAGLEVIGRRRCDAAAAGSVRHAVDGDAAARREGAARRQRGEVGRLAVDRHQAAAGVAVEARHARPSGPRVGMARVLVELARRRRLDDAAAVHHRHAVGVARHHAEVVRDQDQRRSRSRA